MREENISSEDKVQLICLECTAYPRYNLVQGDQGTKAMCTALRDISWFCDFEFPPVDGHKYPVQMSVNSMDTGQEWCSSTYCFRVEVRFQGYCLQEILKIIKKHTFCKLMVSSAYKNSENAA